MNLQKVIIVGVDGATWDVMSPLIDQGKLPNLKRLVENGVSGKLASIDPPYTPIVWTSIATGKLPEAHGVRTVAPTRYEVDTLTIWDILEDFGHSIGISNWPVTWPPRPARGFIIPGSFARSTRTFPLELKFIREICEFGRINRNRRSLTVRKLMLLRKAIKNGMTVSTLKRTMQFYLKSRSANREVHEVYRQILGQSLLTDLYVYLYGRFKPSFSAHYISAVDTAAHLTWKYYEPEKFGIVNSVKVEKYGRLIPLSYENSDECIGKIMHRCVDAKTALIIVSDHGTRASTEGETRFNIRAGELFDKLGLSKAINYFYSEQGVYFLFKSQVSEAKTLKKIEKIRIESTNCKLFNLRRSDIPDLYVIRCKDSSIIGKNPDNTWVDLGGFHAKLSQIVERDDYRISGIHQKNGIFIAYGPNIKRNGKVNMHVTDLIPTLLYYMGLPVGKDMDGQVRFSIFEESWVNKNEVEYIPTYDSKKRRFRYLISKRQESEIVSDKVKKRLRSLGYL